jgi:hypothetical protein
MELIWLKKRLMEKRFRAHVHFGFRSYSERVQSLDLLDNNLHKVSYILTSMIYIVHLEIYFLPLSLIIIVNFVLDMHIKCLG